jgi:hypothetical protein
MGAAAVKATDKGNPMLTKTTKQERLPIAPPHDATRA